MYTLIHCCFLNQLQSSIFYLLSLFSTYMFCRQCNHSIFPLFIFSFHWLGSFHPRHEFSKMFLACSFTDNCPYQTRSLMTIVISIVLHNLVATLLTSSSYFTQYLSLLQPQDALVLLAAKLTKLLSPRFLKIALNNSLPTWKVVARTPHVNKFINLIWYSKFRAEATLF